MLSEQAKREWYLRGELKRLLPLDWELGVAAKIVEIKAELKRLDPRPEYPW